jgi:hypothetical protein
MDWGYVYVAIGAWVALWITLCVVDEICERRERAQTRGPK